MQSPGAAALLVLLLLAQHPGAAPGGGAAAQGGGDDGGAAVGSETFRIAFLQRELEFGLTPDFSSHTVAEHFCRQHGLDAIHVRAVREIVENAVAEALGDDRVAEGMLGRDVEAGWFVASVCRDFPRLHRMSQLDEGRIFTNQLKTLAVRSEPLRIMDAFPFFNEVEMLRVRLAELSPVVDKFILVESAMTHSGKPKELLFEQRRDEFEPWLDKIIHVVMERLPDSKDHWVRERAQRNGIHEGIEQAGAYGEDVVLVSDTDEIPRRSTVRAMSWCDGISTPAQLRSVFYYYSLQHRWSFWVDDVLEPFQARAPCAPRPRGLSRCPLRVRLRFSLSAPDGCMVGVRARGSGNSRGRCWWSSCSIRGLRSTTCATTLASATWCACVFACPMNLL